MACADLISKKLGSGSAAGVAKVCAEVKAEFGEWKELFEKLAPRTQDGIGIIEGIERMVSGECVHARGGRRREGWKEARAQTLTLILHPLFRSLRYECFATLATNGGFRFLLQTLYDSDLLSDEVILFWAEKREAGEGGVGAQKLFAQDNVKEFLEWLQESEEEDDSDEDSD
jgi:hypothetical protein